MNLLTSGLISASPTTTLVATAVMAKEFNVECRSVENGMSKGDMPAKKRKLSLSLEAYRNALKLAADNKAARCKSEGIVVSIFK